MSASLLLGRQRLGRSTSGGGGSPPAIVRYGPDDPARQGTVKRATFTLAGTTFAGIDSPPVHDVGFSRPFAWIADRFGVSWQLNLA